MLASDVDFKLTGWSHLALSDELPACSSKIDNGRELDIFVGDAGMTNAHARTGSAGL